MLNEIWKMKFNKSQITFIFVFMVIVFLAFVLIAISSVKPRETIDHDGLQPVKVFAKSCLEKTANRGLYILGLQNGILLDDYTPVGKYKINYAYRNGSRVTSLKEIETQLKNYINNNLDKCIDDFNQFPEVESKKSDSNIEVIATSNGMIVTADYGAILIIDNMKYRLGKIQITIPVRITLLQNTMEYIVNHYPEIELYPHLSSKPINISIFPIGTDLFYVMIDKNSKIDNIPYKYVFAVKSE